MLRSNGGEDEKLKLQEIVSNAAPTRLFNLMRLSDLNSATHI
jgi:hypothetical protein